MANHKSAEKCIRKTVKRTAINKSRLSRIRTYVRKAEEALTASVSPEQAKAAFVRAEREIMRGVNKGVFLKNTAARKVSHLAQNLKRFVLGK